MFTEKKPDAPRVALVGCAARKLDRAAPARELYTSTMFRAAYEYAEKTCDAVLIVSAVHGVVAPKAVIQPYNRDLRKYRKVEREGWGIRTIGQLVSAFKSPPQLVILAGQVYADALVYGAHWHNLPRPELPLTGIRGCGPRVKWLRIERVKAKIAQRPVEQRCHAECPTWCVSDTPRGPEIQSCDACSSALTRNDPPLLTKNGPPPRRGGRRPRLELSFHRQQHGAMPVEPSRGRAPWPAAPPLVRPCGCRVGVSSG